MRINKDRNSSVRNVAYKPFLLLLVLVILTPVWLNLRTALTLHIPKEEVTAVEDLLSLPSLHTKWQQIISSSAITTEKYDDSAMALPGTAAITTARRKDGNDEEKQHLLRNGTSGRIVRRKEEEEEQQQQRKRAILYLHVGKTGGSTLDAILAANCRWHATYESKHIGQRCHKTLVMHKKKKKKKTNKNGPGHEAQEESEEFRLSKLIKETVHMTEAMNINSNSNSNNKNNKNKNNKKNNNKSNNGTMLQTVVTQAIEKYNITTFLFTLRNPLDRLVSAFNMQHINNTVHWPKRFQAQQPLRVNFYVDCFPTIEDLALVLRNHDDAADDADGKGGTPNQNQVTYIDTTQNTTHDCYDLGRRALHGTGHLFQGGPHLYYNYEKYYRATIGRTRHLNDTNNNNDDHEKEDVFVLRTEHLWDDVHDLNNNHRLWRDSSSSSDGITTTTTQDEEQQQQRIQQVPPTQTFGSERKPVRSGLSQQGKYIMCCYLSRDIEIYQEIVHRALNLNRSQKEQYLTEYLYTDCNNSSDNNKNKSSTTTTTSSDTKFCTGGVRSFL